MNAEPSRADASGEPDGRHAPRLTIGEVLSVLREDFPDVTISKIRYLESEDLVHPQRTPSGYRKFSSADVARLRYVLAAQRDQYLPLRVIKEHLAALDRGEPLPGSAPPAAPPPEEEADTGSLTSDQYLPLRVIKEHLAALDRGEPLPGSAPPAAPPPEEEADTGSLTSDQFARASGLEAGQLADCVQFGLLTPDADGRHPATDLPIARAAAGLARHGIEPRHLRVYQNGAEREAGLVEQLVAPVLRARSEEARNRATEKLRELVALSAQLHGALLEARLRDLLRP